MKRNLHVDLNCDLGESSDTAQLEVQLRILSLVTSVNIACGFHAGDPDLMRHTVQQAQALGVALGAHPGLPDRESCGRRERDISVTEVGDLVAYQVGALAGIAALEGARLSHVKPHGALYTMASRETDIAMAIAEAVLAVNRQLLLVGRSGSRLVDAGRALGLTVVEEAFADRAYHSDGSLVSRDRPAAVIHDLQSVANRALSLVRDGMIDSVDGARIPIRADTLCVHGDTPGAELLVAAIREALANAGIRIAPVLHAQS